MFLGHGKRRNILVGRGSICKKSTSRKAPTVNTHLYVCAMQREGSSDNLLIALHHRTMNKIMGYEVSAERLTLTKTVGL